LLTTQPLLQHRSIATSQHALRAAEAGRMRRYMLKHQLEQDRCIYPAICFIAAQAALAQNPMFSARNIKLVLLI
jgi:hypothetical protein